MIEQSERMLRESAGPTVAQEGYGTTYNAVNGNMQANKSDLLEQMTKYALRATAAKAKLCELEASVMAMQQHLAALSMAT